MKKLLSLTIFALLVCCQVNARAALNLELTKGVKAKIPVAVLPFQFQGAESKAPLKIGKVISGDLQNSSDFSVANTANLTQQPMSVSQINFNYWRAQHVNAIVMGKVQSQGAGQYQISFSLVNVFKTKQAAANGDQSNDEPQQTAAPDVSSNPVLLQRTFTVTKSSLRETAHEISNLIYQKLTGQPGIFMTKVAYIGVQSENGVPVKYSLNVADYDGQNARSLLISTSPIMSPAWSPNGKQLAYVSFENNVPALYSITIADHQRKLISDTRGINSAPAFSPDGKRLAIVLSKSGTPKVYTINLASGALKQITRGWGFDTEPSWSPDGKSLLFTSNRGGSPQIYEVNLATHKTKELTNSGYNVHASFIPGKQAIIFLHREDGLYNVAMKNLTSGNMSVLTHDKLAYSPAVSPNGQLFLYSNFANGQQAINMQSIDGSSGNVWPIQLNVSQEEPAWGPLV